ncbi:tagaturonate reductase [Pararhodonellum marinum]|uniref:tagaturonate reductase n=1 Tax=Pararhodonellum marinum TaxID=2755358 RepID=UPI00188EAEB7|nr:tagaturonate reductase [Pararhodonellum marinum]
MQALNRTTVTKIQERPIKIIQFGEGNFLRGFVDWIIDVMNEKTEFNGDIQVVQPISEGLGKLINQQDGLYHVRLEGLLNGEISEESRLITCLRSVMNPYEDYNDFLKLAENPDLRWMISNTTEAGIAFDADDNEMNYLPQQFPGKLTALLYHRFIHFKGSPEKGMIHIPCELIDKNGEKLKTCILQYAEVFELPEAFGKWIEEHNIFCNTLVDRIVPGFPKDKIGKIQNELGFEDNLVVMAEPFHLWVIEGPDTVQEEFPVESAGLQVKFVKDQAPYRTRKVRILNGAHTCLVPIAYLRGLRTVRESVEDVWAGDFIRKAVFEEIIPTLDLPKEDLESFASDVMDRFRNPFIRHELISIALNSISKFKVRVLPSLLVYHDKEGAWPEKLTASMAALLVFYRGIDLNNEAIPLKDGEEILIFFQEAWKIPNTQEMVEKILGNTDLWEEDLSSHPGLVEKISFQISKILQL